MDKQLQPGWKDLEAYEQGSLCYIDERGQQYDRIDFLAVCNGDIEVARRLFDLCYWQPPQLQLALDEVSIRLPELVHHTGNSVHWLHFPQEPAEQQREALLNGGWTQQEQRTWQCEGELWGVPTGIAYREGGSRDRSPREVAQVRREREAQSQLTEAARLRYDQFNAQVREDMDRMAQGSCYLVERLPRDLSVPANWNTSEITHNRRLHSLFALQIAESVEELWRALDRLVANCEFLVTEVRGLQEVAQIKASKCGGNIVGVFSRETDSELLSVFAATTVRINREPLRERLLRAWREERSFQGERIHQESDKLELLPLLCQVDPGTFNDQQAQTTDTAQAVLRLHGARSAYTYAIEIATHLPDEIAPADAQAFLSILAERKEGAAAQLAIVVPESVYQEIEKGRHAGFSLLQRKATEFLVPQKPA